MIREGLRERFMRDPVPVRLGNLASNLARIASCAPRTSRSETVVSLLNECKHFIEWTGSEVSADYQPELVRLQVELAQWQLRWPLIRNDETARNELAQMARRQSNEVLKWSGLLALRE